MFKKWWKKAISAAFIFGSILFVYTGWIEPNRLVVNSTNISLRHWDQSLNGLKVVAISDIHGGSDFIDESKIKMIVETINSQNPDLIVLLGDFVSQTHDDGNTTVKNQNLKMPMRVIAQSLKGLQAKYGVFAVIGNHDWWYDEKDCRAELENVGFTVLENESKSIEVKGKTVTILGIEDFWKRRTVKIDEILAKLHNRENIIGITHNPDSFDQTTEALAILIAGHTHGGQVNFPILGAPIVPSKKEFTKGHISRDGKNLFVTTGIGTSGLGLRFRVPPEIAVLTFNSQE